MNKNKIAAKVQRLSGNALPWKIENGREVQLPPNFTFLHIKAPTKGRFDLVYVDSKNCISFAAECLEDHGKLYIRCPKEELQEWVKKCHRSNLFWAELKTCGDFCEVVLRHSRKLSGLEWDGKSEGDVFLHCDWGWGDTIQYLRYTQLVKNICKGKVILEVRLGMEKLALTCRGVDCVIRKGDPVPPYDFHRELADLDKITNSIPQPPYLDPPMDGWSSDNTLFKIGVVWRGHHLTFSKFRFLDPQLLSRLNLPYTKLYSLQKHTENPLCTPSFITDLGSCIYNWSDTARILSQMDLLVSIDTSIVHLSSALNKNNKTWVAYPMQNIAEQYHQTWYPNIKLFKNKREDSWSEVIEEMRLELKKILLKRFKVQ